MVGYSRAVATPIAALSACKRASAARMSGRWRASADGRLSGSSPGSVNSPRSNSGGDHAAGARPVRMTSASRAAASCWRNPGKRGAVGGELCFGAQHVGARRLSGLVFEAHQLQVARVVGHDLFGRLELRAQRRDRDRLRDDIAGERKVGRRKLVALLLGERLLLLDAARGRAERVGRIARRRADRIEVRAAAAPLRARRGVELRPLAAARRERVLARGGERRACRGDRPAAVDRGAQHLSQRARAIQLPPLRGNLRAGAQALRLRPGCGAKQLGHRLRRVALAPGCRGTFKIGPDRATRQHEQKESDAFHS